MDPITTAALTRVPEAPGEGPPGGSDAAVDFAVLLALGLPAGTVELTAAPARSAPDDATDAGAPEARDGQIASDESPLAALWVTLTAASVPSPPPPAATSTSDSPVAARTTAGAAAGTAGEPSLFAPRPAPMRAGAPEARTDETSPAGGAVPHAMPEPLARDAVPALAAPAHALERAAAGAATTVTAPTPHIAPLPLGSPPHAPVSGALQFLRQEIAAPVNSPAWPAEFSQQVVWLATHHEQAAELRLHPPELGPLEIRLALPADAGGEASVHFASPHAPVREAIEQALPRLRELLSEAGIPLGDATVGQQLHGDGEHDRRSAPRGTRSETETGGTPGYRAPALAGTSASDRLVDTFA